MGWFLPHFLAVVMAGKLLKLTPFHIGEVGDLDSGLFGEVSGSLACTLGAFGITVLGHLGGSVC